MRRPDGNIGKRRRLCASGVLLALLAILFVGLRLLTAWLLRDEVNGDLAIVQMMVRDMVCDQRIPAFFLGQAYMGSLEPIVNAATHLALGRSNFATEIGTALFTVLMAVSVVRMARRMGGAWAGVAALAFCAIGPMPFAHYAVSPRGGYGVLLFTTAGLLDAGALLISGERQGRPLRAAPAAAAGLLAGIGFWCNQLVFPAVAAVGLCILLLAPRLLLRTRLWLWCAATFALGSAPFWFWNARNGWESFQMAGSLVLDPVSAARNAVLLVSKRIPELWGVAGVARIAAAAIVAASVILPALSLRAFAPLPRRIHPDENPATTEAKTQMAICWAYLAIFALCFAFSHFAVSNTPRYLLSAIPAVAALSGAACALTRFRSANALAALLLAGLVVWEAHLLPNLAAKGRKDAARTAGYRKAVAYMESRGVAAAYCPFLHNSLNLVGTGGIAFSDSNLERVPAFRFQAEAAPSPAVVEDFLGIARWATASGGSLCATNIGGLRLATDITPPAAAVDVSPTPGSGPADSITPALFDRNFATALEMAGKELSVDIPLGGTRRICGVRALVSGLDGTASLQVLGRAATNEPLKRLARKVPNVQCRWSGPRFYPDPHCPVIESHFPECELSALRLVFRSAADGGAIRMIREVQLLGPADSQGDRRQDGSTTQSASPLVAALRRQGMRRLYAGRWAANAVSLETRGAIWTNCGQDLHPKATGCPAPRMRPAPVEIDESTALFVSMSGERAMRDVLLKTGISMRRLPVEGLGVLFIPETVQTVPFGPGVPTGIVFDGDIPSFMPSAEWAAARLADATDVRAIRQGPPTVPSLRALMALSLPDGDAAEVRAALDRLVRPAIGGEAVFDGKWTWHGARMLSPEDAAIPGGSARIRHYWSSPRGLPPPPGALSVFMRLDGPGGFRLRDAYLLEIPPEGLDDVSEDGATWHIDRDVAIPPDAPPGLYEMRIGISDALYPSRRLSLDTRLPRRRNAAIAGTAFAIGTPTTQD